MPEPVAGDGEIVVRMSAASVNPFDNTVRRGWVAQVPPGLIQGNEGAGVVVGGSRDMPAGTRVMLMGAYGFARSGTWQEIRDGRADRRDEGARQSQRRRSRCGAGRLYRGPTGIDQRHWAYAGHDAVDPRRRRIGRECSDPTRVRVKGRDGCITSAGRTEKAEQARSLRLQDVIDLAKESLSEGVMRLTDGKGADVALDSIGGAITGEALKSVAPGGRVIQMGYTGGTDLNVSSLTLDLECAGSRWVDERRGVQHLLPAAGGLCREAWANDPAAPRRWHGQARDRPNVSTRGGAQRRLGI